MVPGTHYQMEAMSANMGRALMKFSEVPTVVQDGLTALPTQESRRLIGPLISKVDEGMKPSKDLQGKG
jgi:hypothetical protein